MNQSRAKSLRHSPRIAATIVAAASALMIAACGGGGDDPKAANQLYTQSNETANAVIHFVRQSDGTLVRKESTPTGGAGTNGVGKAGATVPDSLASQHSIIISADGTTVFVVNGGDNSISTMSVDPSTGALTLKKKTATAAGSIPNSLALDKGFLYATFLNGASQLAAYKLQDDGSLTQVGAYNLATLGGLTASAVAPTQVIASPDGGFIVVNPGTGTNAVMSFAVQADGTLATPVTTASIVTPFASSFVPGAASPTYLATGITALSLTSYAFAGTGALTQVGQGVAAGVAAPCWLQVTPSGSVAFVGNGSGAISSFSISAAGGVTLLNSTAAVEPSATKGVNSVAADSWISPDGKFLYTAYLGDDKVVAYSIGLGGSLAKLGETVIGTASKLSLQGMAGL